MYTFLSFLFSFRKNLGGRGGGGGRYHCSYRVRIPNVVSSAVGNTTYMYVYFTWNLWKKSFVLHEVHINNFYDAKVKIRVFLERGL